MSKEAISAELSPVQDLLSSFFKWFGEIAFFSARVARAAITPPYEFRELIRQLDEVGSKSALLIVLAGAAMGVVLSLETRSSLIRFGAESSLPAIIMISIVTETDGLSPDSSPAAAWEPASVRPWAR
jgi:phospholipid/cholesterol/gamma-HCH transport system permease protein